MGMKQNAYPDAGLRDKLDTWVQFESNHLTPPSGVKLLGDSLFGYLYVNRGVGFELRVGGEAKARPRGVLTPTQNLAGAKWDLHYEAIKSLALRQLGPRGCRALALPTRPPELCRHFHSNLEQSRRCLSLDPYRLPGHPDLLCAWKPLGANLRETQVLLRLEEETYPGVYECILVDPKGAAPSGARILAIPFEWHGEGGLYIYQDPAVACGKTP